MAHQRWLAEVIHFESGPFTYSRVLAVVFILLLTRVLLPPLMAPGALPQGTLRQTTQSSVQRTRLIGPLQEKQPITPDHNRGSYGSHDITATSVLFIFLNILFLLTYVYD